jgi:hypothetical protein
MSGADILVERSGMYALIEGVYGSNYESPEHHHSGSLLVLFAYKIHVADFWQIAIEPLLKGEVLKTATEVKNQPMLFALQQSP